jgi:zinc protease
MTTTARTLPNGMLVLLRESHAAPVATCWVWYRVGARDEPRDLSGISHWVEHMLFKGTPAIPKGAMDRLVARNGGTFNGFTSADYTAYYETLPADRIALGLEIESDRMANALFDPNEVESERTVILSELEGRENHPGYWLDRELRALAFVTHPYRQTVLGSKETLRAMTRAELYAHYQTYYMPNNAVLVLVGDFDSAKMLELAQRRFGELPPGPPLPKVRAVEPEPQGERRVVVRRPGPATYVQTSYLAADCSSADFAALLVLDAVLSGAKPMGGNGAQTNRSARIYRALVESELASSAGSGFAATRDPSLFTLRATVRAGQSAEAVERSLIDVVGRIAREGVPADELATKLRQVRAQLAYGLDGVSGIARRLGMWEVLDSYARVDRMPGELAVVTPDDVQRVAQTYLTERRRIVGHFVPG